MAIAHIYIYIVYIYICKPIRPTKVGIGGYTGVGTPQKTTQSPDRPYNAPTDYTKPQKHYTKTKNIRQNPKILDMNLNYSTRVATNINLTYNIPYPI